MNLEFLGICSYLDGSTENMVVFMDALEPTFFICITRELNLESFHCTTSPPQFFVFYLERSVHYGAKASFEFAIPLAEPESTLGLQTCINVPTANHFY